MGSLQGCSQCFWRTIQHLDNWPPTGFSPDGIFNTVFGRDVFHPNLTLFEVLNPEKPLNLLKQLALQSTAALLNAAHPSISYPLTPAQVINMFHAAFDSGDFEPTKDLFNAYNNLCCPLS